MTKYNNSPTEFLSLFLLLSFFITSNNSFAQVAATKNVDAFNSAEKIHIPSQSKAETDSAKIPVIVEAESGTIGSNFSLGNNGKLPM